MGRCGKRGRSSPHQRHAQAVSAKLVIQPLDGEIRRKQERAKLFGSPGEAVVYERKPELRAFRRGQVQNPSGVEPANTLRGPKAPGQAQVIEVAREPKTGVEGIRGLGEEVVVGVAGAIVIEATGRALL